MLLAANQVLCWVLAVGLSTCTSDHQFSSLPKPASQRNCQGPRQAAAPNPSSLPITMTVDKIVTDPALVATLQISDTARDQAHELLQLVDGSDDTASRDPIDIAKRQKLLLTSISQLRGLHRAACLAARDTKAQTAERRQEVDKLHLQLQNLYYEQKHLQGEISACESYDHKYQQLPLIPVEEFLAQNPDRANDDENELMYARIEHERAEREDLEQKRQELLKRKQKLIAENKRRKDDLANLDQDLEKFIDAAKPILELFEKAP